MSKFLYEMKAWFHSLACGYVSFQHHLLKSTISSPFSHWVILVSVLIKVLQRSKPIRCVCVYLCLSVVYRGTRWGERKGERDLRNQLMQFGGWQAQIFRAGPQTWDPKEHWCCSSGPKTNWKQNPFFLGGPQSVFSSRFQLIGWIPPTL